LPRPLGRGTPIPRRTEIPPPGVVLGSALQWSRGPDYPGGNFSAGSCVIANGVLYCVGGIDPADQTENIPEASYFAQIDSSGTGIGNWQHTTEYGQGGTFKTI